MSLVLLLTLGLVQTALALYARNVVISAAHEGVRAGIELGRNPAESVAIARSTVDGSARGVVDDLDIDVSVTGPRDTSVLRVDVSATLDAFGPIPIGIPVRASVADFLERSAL